MANSMFTKGLEDILSGNYGWSISNVRCCLVRDYTFSASHSFLSDVVSSGATIASYSDNLSGKTHAGGVADASDATFASVAAGDPIDCIILYFEAGGTDATRRLIAYIDEASGTLPVTPDGSDIVVQWSNGTERILKL